MPTFRNRLKNAIDLSNYSEQRKRLAKDAELGEKTIYNLLNDNRLDTSKTGPGLFAMARVASLLGCSLDYLAGMEHATPPIAEDKQVHPLIQRMRAAGSQQAIRPGIQPSVDALLRLHLRTGGRLEGFEEVLPFCDRYEHVNSGDAHLKVLEVGEKSLAALTMGKACAETLQYALINSDDRELTPRLLRDHKEAQERGTLSTLETLNVPMPNKPVFVKLDYARALLSVVDANGTRSTLCFASVVV